MPPAGMTTERERPPLMAAAAPRRHGTRAHMGTQTHTDTHTGGLHQPFICGPSPRSLGFQLFQTSGRAVRITGASPPPRHGEQKRPQNRMAPVLPCWMKKRKGRSAKNCRPMLRPSSVMLSTVMGTASVPSLVTSMKDLCTTLDRCRPHPDDIPVKSAQAALKASVMPRFWRMPSML